MSLCACPVAEQVPLLLAFPPHHSPSTHETLILSRHLHKQEQRGPSNSSLFLSLGILPGTIRRTAETGGSFHQPTPLSLQLTDSLHPDPLDTLQLLQGQCCFFTNRSKLLQDPTQKTQEQASSGWAPGSCPSWPLPSHPFLLNILILRVYPVFSTFSPVSPR